MSSIFDRQTRKWVGKSGKKILKVWKYMHDLLKE
jgi:hypothetical protein